MMISRIAAIADYASTSDGGKLNVLGVFGIIHALTVPAMHPQMWLVMQLEFDAHDAGDKSLTILLEADDGEPILQMSGIMNVPPQLEGQPSIVNSLMQLNGIPFPKFGRYQFKIQIADEEEITIPLTVALSVPRP
jgi:hypothetical protein